MMKEARSLLRIITDNLRGVRERSQQRSDKAGDSGMEFPPDGADAYKEASPAFAAMSLSRRQSDSESEAVFDQMYAQKIPAVECD